MMCDTLNFGTNSGECGSPGVVEKRCKKVSSYQPKSNRRSLKEHQPCLDLSAISTAQNNHLSYATPDSASSGLKSPTKRQAGTLLTRRKSRPPKLRITAPSVEMMQLSFDKSFDPYQLFEVDHTACLLIHVTVLDAQNVTKGWASDFLDTPDPYIELRIRTAPDGKKRTRTIDNDTNPNWNESFTFLHDPRLECKLEISLMEANYTSDQVLGTEIINCHELEYDKLQKRTLTFNEKTKLRIEIKLEYNSNPDLRYSLCIPDEEKYFLNNRKCRVYESICNLLDEEGPQSLNEVPNIAVIGSGGGFRAMVGFSGVINALYKSKLLDCVTYVGGLSGSTWYLSTLYSHSKWPYIQPEKVQEEMKYNIDSSLLWLLKPQSIYRYLDRILHKKQNGQPVSFTDFFGHMVGETILKGRLESKLSDQQEKIVSGDVPMPLYTCVHVKKDVSAKSFQEWVEFTPFEIGLPKYGTYMKVEQFGSKFFLGKLCRSFEEPPLHFLQGIWGSAFCILFKRLFEDNRKLDPVEMIRQNISDELDKKQECSSTDSSDSEEEPENNDSRRESNESVQSDVTMMSDGSCMSDLDKDLDAVDNFQPNCRRNSQDNILDVETARRNAFESLNKCIAPDDTLNGLYDYNDDDEEKEEDEEEEEKKVLNCRLVRKNGRRYRHKLDRSEVKRKQSTKKEYGFWRKVMIGLVENKNIEILSTRAGRAGIVHNPMRGLSLQKLYPLSPFTQIPSKEHFSIPDEFDGNFEMHSTEIKKLYMVDAGLTFNSPYPLVLRPQRAVSLILSFDFSARPTDDHPPFYELLLAEKWARINNIPFPPIDTSVFEKEGMKELYVFRHPNDPYCPVVMHFVLCNKTFREFKAPGIPRETPEEKEFANFSIFEDPAAPYSTFNFKYSHLAFDRLAKLTEFNTLLHVEEIKKCIAEQVELKRFLPTRVPVDSKNVKHLPIKDVNRQAILKNYLRHIKNRNSADVAELERKYSINGTPPSTSSPMERSKKLSFCLPSRHVNRYSCQSIYFDALDLSEGEDQDDSSDESLPFHSPLTGPSPTDVNEFA